jgi:hypothetical protein
MDQSVEADLFVYGDTFNPQAGFSTELGSDLQHLAVERPDLVKSVMTMRWTLGGVKIGDGFKDLVAADLEILDEHMNVQVTEGSEFGSGSVARLYEPALGLAPGSVGPAQRVRGRPFGAHRRRAAGQPAGSFWHCRAPWRRCARRRPAKSYRRSGLPPFYVPVAMLVLAR